MNNKYYWAYILNPEEEITSEFNEKEKIGCVLIKKDDEYKELFTDAKFMATREFSVIDGKKLFDDSISLFGIIDREISMEDVVNFTYKSDIDKTEYINLIIKLIANTRKKAVTGFKEYYEYEKTFKKEVNANRK